MEGHGEAGQTVQRSKQDSQDTLFYCDPPYVKSPRTAKCVYRHEMTEDDHRALLDLLAKVEGKFMLSRYRCPLYDSWADQLGFVRHDADIDNKASGVKSKREIIGSLCSATKLTRTWRLPMSARRPSSRLRPGGRDVSLAFACGPCLTRRPGS